MENTLFEPVLTHDKPHIDDGRVPSYVRATGCAIAGNVTAANTVANERQANINAEAP